MSSLIEDLDNLAERQRRRLQEQETALEVNKIKQWVESNQAKIVSAPGPIHPTVTDTLTARGSRYGKFTGQAEATQSLKKIIMRHIYANATKFDPDQIEALDMICNKIGRIVNGDPNYDDSWIDIAGYATLVADRLRGIAR